MSWKINKPCLIILKNYFYYGKKTAVLLWERASEFNELFFFIGVTVKLDSKKDRESFLSTTITLDDVLEKFQYHPSIKEISKTFNNNEKYFVYEVTEDK